jgi:hypothetical protein
MAYVPGYDQDVFISYAHVDNKEMIYGEGEPIPWVTTFKGELQTRLDKSLGKTGVKIWMDREALPGNESVTQTLESAVRNTATLIVMLSTGYLESEWCKKEVQDFVNLAGTEGRLFIVHLQNIPLEERPEAMQDLNGFPFFDEAGDDPLPPSAKAYVTSMLNLKNSLSKKLKELKPQQLSRENPLGEPLHESKKQMALLFAEGTPDLNYDLASIKIYFDKLGYRILPEKPYRRGAQEFQEMLDQDLGEAKLFVQLLGPYGTQRTEDLPEGYEGLQLDRARKLKLPLLRAYRRDTINVKAMSDPVQRSILEASDVMALDLEEFKSKIKMTLEELSFREIIPAVTEDSEKPIVIYANKSDQNSAFKIRDVLKSKNLLSYIYFHEDPLMDLAKQMNPAGLVLVYGETTENTWIRERVKDFRDITLIRKPIQPICALYFDPAEKRDQMLIAPLPEFLCDLDSDSGEDVFKEYIGKLIEVRAKLSTS